MWETMKTWMSGLGGFTLSKVLPAVIILVIGILAIRLLMRVVTAALEKSRLDKVAHKLLKSVLQTVLYVLLGLIAASKLGIDVTGIVALASVLTLAVSLSVQNALTNVIGGFTLLYTKPFTAGDYVEIAGQSGTVREVGVTYTKLATPDNKVVSIPNSAVVSTQIVNFTVLGTRRVDVTVSASYDTPVEQTLEALRQAAKVPTAMEEPAPLAVVATYGESTISYKLQVWCQSSDYWTTVFDVNKRVKEIFDAQGVQMSYPHLNVHLDKE